MNEDTPNMEVQKFPQKVGVTSQREIENAVREAVQGGRLARNEKLKPRVTLKVKSVNLALVIEDNIGFLNEVFRVSAVHASTGSAQTEKAQQL